MKKRFTRPVTVLMSVLFTAVMFIVSSEASEPDALAVPPVRCPIPESFTDEARAFQGISSLCVSADDRAWACWYAGGPTECGQNYVLTATSADGGLTWSKPLFAVDPAGVVRAFDATMWTDPNGRLWLFWSQGEDIGNSVKGCPNIWDGRVGVWEMHTDNPQEGEKAVWSTPKRLCDGIMMCKPIVDSKGRWLYPVSIWRFQSKFTLPENLLGANVYVSTDGGNTLSYLGGVNVPKNVSIFDEHNIVERKDGTLWLANRTRGGIGESVSSDGGKTWSEFQPSTIKHTSSRFFLRRLKSGNLLLVKNGAADENCGRMKMTAMISTDDGKTWSDGLLLDERSGVSYPDGDQLSDGTIVVTYDYNRYTNREIYCARFTEKDILEQKIVSDTGKLKIIINKATGPMK